MKSGMGVILQGCFLGGFWPRTPTPQGMGPQTGILGGFVENLKTKLVKHTQISGGKSCFCPPNPDTEWPDPYVFILT